MDRKSKIIFFKIGAGTVSSIIGAFMIMLIIQIYSGSIITYLELPIYIGMDFSKTNNSPISFKPLKRGEIQGKLLLLNNNSRNNVAKVRLVRLDDFNLEKIFLGSSGSSIPWDTFSSNPKIRIWGDKFVIDNLCLPSGQATMLFLATRNPPSSSPVDKSSNTQIVTSEILTFNERDTMKTLHLLFISAVTACLFGFFILVVYFLSKLEK
jgi:hypothetical protein